MISVDATKIAKLEAEVAALELERDHLVMAIVREGLKIGSHGSGLCITDESLARRDAEKRAEGGEYIASVVGGAHDRKLALMRVAELRRQAKGGER